jgi:hypothetical protein
MAAVVRGRFSLLRNCVMRRLGTGLPGETWAWTNEMSRIGEDSEINVPPRASGGFQIEELRA